MRSSKALRSNSRYAHRRARLPLERQLAIEPLEERALLSVSNSAPLTTILAANSAPVVSSLQVVEYDVATHTQRVLSAQESQAAFAELLALVGANKNGASLAGGNHTESHEGVPTGALLQDFNGPAASNLAFDPEDRTLVPIDQVTTYPYSANARLTANFNDLIQESSSATMIDPFHAITAGHSIFSHRLTNPDYATSVTVSPAQHGNAIVPQDGQRSDYQPYGQAMATRFRTFTAWTQNEDYDYDIAMVTLDRNIGNFTGWYGIGYPDNYNYLEANKGTISGYPGTDSGLSDDGMQMYTQTGYATTFGITEHELRTNTMNTSHGQSGAGVSFVDETVYAVVSHGHDEGGVTQYDAFTRVTPGVFDSFVQGMRDDANFEPPVDRPDLVDYDRWFNSSFATASDHTLIAGDPVTVKSYPRNNGTAAAGSFNVRFRLSTDKTYNSTTDYLLGDVTVSSLAAFSNATATVTANCPDIPHGDYYLVWSIDSGNTVAEYVDGDNTGVSSFQITVSIAPDAYEANDSFATASSLGALGVISIQDLSIHAAGNDDYYRFTASNTGTATVAIAFSSSQGNVSLHVYDANQNLLDESTFIRVDSQILNVPVTTGQTYYVKVNGYGSVEVNPDYSMSIAGPEISPDNYEPNDSFETAASLGTFSSFSYENLTVHEPNNDDYYSFVASTTGTATASISFSHAAGDLDLQAYDYGHTLLKSSVSSNDTETVAIAITFGQIYYLKVKGFGGAVNGNYSMLIVQGVPEIDVKGNDVSIVDGDPTASTTDGTDFGLIDVGSSLVRTFTIFNSGDAPLVLGPSPRLYLDDTTNFTVMTLPAATVPAGGSTTFQIQFAPTSTDTHVAHVTIANNDAGEGPYNFTIQGTGNFTGAPTLSISDVQIAEGDSGTKKAVFTVTLSARPTHTVLVHYATADGTAAAGSDFTTAAGMLTFNPRVTSQKVSVTIKGDSKLESNETFLVNLDGATGAFISDAQGVGTILNDEKPAITINDVAVNEGVNRSTNQAVFTVALSQPTTQTVRVRYATVNGTATAGNGDYIAKSGMLTFRPGVTSQQVVVTVRGDNRVEPNETFTVLLSSPTAATIADNKGIGTILDDDGTTTTTTTLIAAASKPVASPTSSGATSVAAAPSSKTSTSSQLSLLQTIIEDKILKAAKTRAPSAATAADFLFGTLGLKL